MISLAHCRTMAAYNRWMNERLYAAAAQLGDAQRKEDVKAFFKWMGRFTGRPFHVTALSQELYADFEELRQGRAKTDAGISDWMEKLSEETLAGDLVYASIAKPEPRRMPMWIALAHFFNHQTHHRGQVTTLLTQRGIAPGDTDLILMPGRPD